MMLRTDEYARIKSKSSYSDELEDWVVPAFIFKQKDVVFPKLNGMALVNDQLDQRSVQIVGEGINSSRAGYSTKESDKKSKKADEKSMINKL